MSKMVKNACSFLQKRCGTFVEIFGEIFFLVRCTEIPKYRNTEIPKYPKKALENRPNVKNGQKRMISFAKVAENVFLNLWGKKILVRCPEIPKYRNTGIPKYPKKDLKNCQNVNNGQKWMIFLQNVRKITGSVLTKKIFWSDVPKYRNTGIPKYRNTQKKAKWPIMVKNACVFL